MMARLESSSCSLVSKRVKRCGPFILVFGSSLVVLVY
uniref:Uncharacterized protein n=1 Tax=Rhizophora mucronata TaxID=61149 RepID=A0A2P2QDF4_RHIMU